MKAYLLDAFSGVENSFVATSNPANVKYQSLFYGLWSICSHIVGIP